MSTNTQSASAPAVFRINAVELRVVTDKNGNPWFAAQEVCAILGYTNPRKAVSDHCRDDGVTKRDTIDALGRTQGSTFINEGNLYRLMVKSRKPAAQEFERIVMDEILPAIRRTGKYEAPRTKAAVSGCLTCEQQDAVKALVRSRIEALPAAEQGAAAIKLWSAIKTKFGAGYKQVSEQHFGEVLSLVARLEVGTISALPALPSPRRRNTPSKADFAAYREVLTTKIDAELPAHIQQRIHAALARSLASVAPDLAPRAVGFVRVDRWLNTPR